MRSFSLIDQYLGMSLEMDLSGLHPGGYAVTETNRRLRCEPSYGFVHALLGIVFTDGRLAFSTTPGTRSTVLQLLKLNQFDAETTIDPVWLNQLAASVNDARLQTGFSPIRGVYEGLIFACNSSLVKHYDHDQCLPLHDERLPPATGLSLPTHCFPDGIVYGIVQDNQIVSVAYAHRSGKMENQVADLAVETATAYRQRGYAKTVVSAVTDHFARFGGEAVYKCSPGNSASIATATSVGYAFYGRMIVVSAPAPEATTS